MWHIVAHAWRTLLTLITSPHTALYPPTGDTHAVEVSAADLFHLQPSEFLNDTVIDLYLKKLERVRISCIPLCMRALRLLALRCALSTPGAAGADGAAEQARALLQHLLLQEAVAEVWQA